MWVYVAAQYKQTHVWHRGRWHTGGRTCCWLRLRHGRWLRSHGLHIVQGRRKVQLHRQQPGCVSRGKHVAKYRQIAPRGAFTVM